MKSTIPQTTTLSEAAHAYSKAGEELERTRKAAAEARRKHKAAHAILQEALARHLASAR
jgi:hypothetical protein